MFEDLALVGGCCGLGFGVMVILGLEALCFDGLDVLLAVWGLGWSLGLDVGVGDPCCG